MAVSLKQAGVANATSDPLADNVTAVFCISDGVLREIKNNLELTVSPGVLLPSSATPSSTAPFGPSFRPVSDGAGGAACVAFPPIPFATSEARTIIAVLNQHIDSAGSGVLLGGDLHGSNASHLAIRSGKVRTIGGPDGLSVATGAHSIISTGTQYGGGLKQYIDGVIDPAYAGGLSDPYVNGNLKLDHIGGVPGADGHCSSDIVYLVLLDVEVSAADAARLHASLTGDGAFALVTVSGVGATTDFIGPNIADFSCVVGQPITPRDVSTLFASATTRTYSKGGTWPAWASLDVNTGVITGTSTNTTGSPFNNCTVVAFDMQGTGVPSNTFKFTVTAAGGGTSVGSLTTDELANNTDTGMKNAPVSWCFLPNYRVGDASVPFAPIVGSGTTDSVPRLTIGSGLPDPPKGTLIVVKRHATDSQQDRVIYQYFP